MKVPFYRHNLDQECIDRVSRVLKGDMLTTGAVCSEFEGEFANYFGPEYSAVTFSSWTTGAFCTLVAWEIGPGDEVIVPSMSFLSTANIVEHVGAKPVFVDCDLRTGLISTDAVLEAITSKTRAIIPVHLYGQMCDMKTLSKIAKVRGIKLLEDCAHCIEGAREDYRPGLLSDAAVFSFYATKNITSCEGGAVITRNAETSGILAKLRLHGMDKSAISRYIEGYKHWDMDLLGYKANLSDLNAALLQPQLRRLGERLERRQQICAFYEDIFGQFEIGFPITEQQVEHARHLFTILVLPSKRDSLIQKLQEADIGVAVNFKPIHSMTYYRKKYGYRPDALKNTELIGSSTISIPMYPALEDSQVEYVASTVCRLVRG